MSRACAAALAGVLLLSGCSMPGSPQAQQKSSKSTVLETVSGVPITTADVQKRINLWTLFSPSAAAGLKTSSGKQGVETRLEQEILLYKEAEKEKVQAPASQVTSEEKGIESGLQSAYGSKSGVDKELKKLGLSQSDITNYVKRLLRIEALLKKKVPTPTVTKAEEQAYYKSHHATYTTPEQYHVRHILLKTKTKAEAVLKQLKAGANFATLAKKDSIDPGSAKQGGDLGWITLAQVVPPFAKAVKSLKVGQLSGIVHSTYGYHILEVLAVKPPALQPFSAVSGQIQKQLVGQKETAAIDKYIKSLRAKAVIRKGSGNGA